MISEGENLWFKSSEESDMRGSTIFSFINIECMVLYRLCISNEQPSPPPWYTTQLFSAESHLSACYRGAGCSADRTSAFSTSSPDCWSACTGSPSYSCLPEVPCQVSTCLCCSPTNGCCSDPSPALSLLFYAFPAVDQKSQPLKLATR